jgi:hypothetical protein
MYYLFYYFSGSEDSLVAIKQLFSKRIIPYLNKKLTIKPWIERVSQKEQKLRSTGVAFNKENPEFLLLVKFIFLQMWDTNKKVLLVENVWFVLSRLCEFSSKQGNIRLFLKVVERFHDPVDSASNYLRKFTSLEHPQFLKRLRALFKVGVDIEEFFLIMFLFIFEKVHSKKSTHNRSTEYVFSYFINKLKVWLFAVIMQG